MNILIQGFISEEQARTFIEWFAGQGEDNLDIWFDCNDVPSCSTDIEKSYPITKINDDTLTFFVQNR